MEEKSYQEGPKGERKRGERDFGGGKKKAKKGGAKPTTERRKSGGLEKEMNIKRNPGDNWVGKEIQKRRGRRSLSIS